VDIDAVAQRVDVEALVGRTEMGSLIARSTTSVAINVLDVGRDEVVVLDRFVHRVIDRILRRETDVLRGPPLLLDLGTKGPPP
jgi:hypothetical protein